jgi:hypothetical protein
MSAKPDRHSKTTVETGSGVRVAGRVAVIAVVGVGERNAVGVLTDWQEARRIA